MTTEDVTLAFCRMLQRIAGCGALWKKIRRLCPRNGIGADCESMHAQPFCKNLCTTFAKARPFASQTLLPCRGARVMSSERRTVRWRWDRAGSDVGCSAESGHGSEAGTFRSLGDAAIAQPSLFGRPVVTFSTLTSQPQPPGILRTFMPHSTASGLHSAPATLPSPSQSRAG